MVVFAYWVFFFPLVCGQDLDMLEALPTGILATLATGDPLLSAGMKDGDAAGSALKAIENLADPLLKPFVEGLDPSKKMSDPFSEPFKLHLPIVKPVILPLKPHVRFGKPVKVLKAAVPLKKVALKKAVGAKMLMPKVKVKAALKAKPKVYSLKPIIHVIEKPVPVFHKVPIPKKVMIPKYYPVKKAILVPKIVPVPFKVPIKKIIPKIVKIPKPFPVPKFVPVKKYIPVGIPYPVPKFYKVPIPKPVPYAKYIPIPIPKKVPKFIPFPVKKIIKVPKPYYVPIKVPHITTSYMKTPMVVKVPDIKKTPWHSKPFKGNKLDFIEPESPDIFKMKDAETDQFGNSLK
ncbi:hypothetical protein HNY73_012393 [Argiope bruennichi]|uniref:Uncharacterized protein n=1 Tax=Argiope bruennichi TaxID=94029 RepID=A0A8T0EVC4_ARGBR|nr:hypothetical protein HNY73_012393 [Argiope bruennichi]